MPRMNFKKIGLMLCASTFALTVTPVSPALADRIADYGNISSEALLQQNAGIAGSIEALLRSGGAPDFLSNPAATADF